MSVCLVKQLLCWICCSCHGFLFPCFTRKLDFHNIIFLSARSSAEQLFPPETHSTFIWIMEKEDRLGRCVCVYISIFSPWSTEGYFDLSSDNSCYTWENFWVDISFSPGRPQGRCLVDLKVKSRYLIPGGRSLNKQANLASTFYHPVSLAFLARLIEHRKGKLQRGFELNLDCFALLLRLVKKNK